MAIGSKTAASLVLALCLASLVGAQQGLLPTNDRITVSTETTQDAGRSGLQINCEILGASLYVDRSYFGTTPYSGFIAPGNHYFELDLPGYDVLGIWLTLAEKTTYTISFNPDQRVPLFAGNSRVSVTSVPTLNAGLSDFEVYCAIGGGELYIDKVDMGTVPDSNLSFAGTIAPGSHYFELENIPGYRILGFWLLLAEKTKYTLSFNPERIMGRLSVQIQPSDASVSVDGTPVGRGEVDVPAGSHRVEVRRFGYSEQSLTVVVAEASTNVIELSLEKAVFAVNGLGFDRGVFNPNNAGAPGRTNLEFQATNYGSARAEIRGADGALVATLDFPDIKTWGQASTWNGLDQKGKALPDGRYSVVLRAAPAPGVPVQSEGTAPDGQEVGPDGAVSLRTEVSIDSTLVVRAFGTASAVPGLLYMPDPLPQPAGTLAAESSWFAPLASPQSSAIGISAALSLAGVAVIAAHAAVETGSSPNAGGDLSASALIALFGDRTEPLGGAFFLRGSYTSSASPEMPGAGSAIEASAPLSVRFGEFSFALSPGALVDFASSPAAFLGLARTGLWLEGRSFRVGASGELPLDFSLGLPRPRWPARAALEGRLILGSTPFVASAYLDALLEPATAAVFEAGLGLGLLF